MKRFTVLLDSGEWGIGNSVYTAAKAAGITEDSEPTPARVYYADRKRVKGEIVGNAHNGVAWEWTDEFKATTLKGHHIGSAVYKKAMNDLEIYRGELRLEKTPVRYKGDMKIYRMQVLVELEHKPKA